MREKIIEDFRMNKNKPNNTLHIPLLKDVGEVGYLAGATVSGSALIDEDVTNPLCCAKQVYVDLSDRSEVLSEKYVSYIQDGEPEYLRMFFIKVDSEKFLLDPWGLYSEGTEKYVDNERGVPKWMYARVSQQCFEHYIRFLVTRNKKFLRDAERCL